MTGSHAAPYGSADGIPPSLLRQEEPLHVRRHTVLRTPPYPGKPLAAAAPALIHPLLPAAGSGYGESGDGAVLHPLLSLVVDEAKPVVPRTEERPIRNIIHIHLPSGQGRVAPFFPYPQLSISAISSSSHSSQPGTPTLSSSWPKPPSGCATFTLTLAPHPSHEESVMSMP